MKWNKTVSWDLLPDTLLNSERFLMIIREALNSEEYRTQGMPDVFYDTRIIPITKDSGKPMTPENTRLIAINPLLTRVMEAVVKNRLNPLI